MTSTARARRRRGSVRAAPDRAGEGRPRDRPACADRDARRPDALRALRHGRGRELGHAARRVTFDRRCCTICARCPRAWSGCSMASRSPRARCRRRRRSSTTSSRNTPTLPPQPGRDRLTIGARAQHDARHSSGTSSQFPTAIRATARTRWRMRPIAIRYMLERADRRRARREVELQRRRDRLARPADCQGHRREAARLSPAACCSIRWVSARANGRSARDGRAARGSGLRLLPRDMSKIGQLVLAGGAWNGKQVVPAEWVKRATTPVVDDRRSRRLRLSVVHRRPRSTGTPRRCLDRRHRLGRPATLRRSAARSRGRHQLRQLPPVRQGAERGRHRDRDRGGAAGLYLMPIAP